MPSTRPFIPRIVLAFDFDGTLASDTTDAVLEIYGIGREDWSGEFEQPLGQGWDQIIRRGQALIRLGEAKGEPLTLDVLRRAAERVSPFDGVLEMPERLARAARAVHDDIRVECVIVSSGYAEIMKATPVVEGFARVFASTFHFGPDGRAICLKRIVAHPMKALYLDAIAKDLDVDGANAPEAAGRDVDEHERHVPFEQMVYVGDGASDLHAFGFMRRQGGFAIAIDKGDSFEHADAQRRSQRVDNLARPDYRPGSELLESLEHAVRSAAERVALRALGRGE